MVQIDGSHHAWFGHQSSCLIGAIDDATGKIVGAKFSKTETSLDTMIVVEQILNRYGRFHMLYSDKAGIFDNKKREGFTNVTRALQQLDIISILANSPQAKGRIERLWGTLQDRLVSEMRIRNISTIKDANEYLPEFIEYYNKKFSVLPSNCESAYRPLPAEIDLDKVFCIIEERIVHTGNRVCIDNQKLIINTNLGYSLRDKIVEIKTYRDGTRKFFVDTKEVQVEQLLDPQKAA
ncbi:MAG: ISNCY family transposase [Oligoflexia bacterium]|nr:ISNCY family transposase [Oligoflexia bacterium]